MLCPTNVRITADFPVSAWHAPLQTSDFKRQKQITSLNGIYATGAPALLLLFVSDPGPTLLQNTGLILAAVGIWIDVVTGRFMRHLRERSQADPAPSQEQKRWFQRSRRTLIVFRMVTLGTAALCALAYVFGLDVMCALRGPELVKACAG